MMCSHYPLISDREKIFLLNNDLLSVGFPKTQWRFTSSIIYEHQHFFGKFPEFHSLYN